MKQHKKLIIALGDRTGKITDDPKVNHILDCVLNEDVPYDAEYYEEEIAACVLGGGVLLT